MNNRDYHVDVVILTYKPEQKLRAVINILNRQTHPINKIIIINTEKKYLQDLFVGISNVEIHHIRKQDFDHGATRNLGMSFSNSPFVLFMTQDAIPKNLYLIEELLKPFADDTVAVSYARQLPASDCEYIEKYMRSYNYPDTDRIKSQMDIPHMGMKTFFCSDVCAIYRRDIFLELGGFVDRTIFNEDMIYGRTVISSGKKIAYMSKALVVHSHNYSLIKLFQRNFDMGVSQIEYADAFAGVKTENEGMKLLKSTAKHLLTSRRFYYLPLLILKSGCRFIGYKLGKMYKKLPKRLVVICSMNKGYWKK